MPLEWNEERLLMIANATLCVCSAATMRHLSHTAVS